MSSSTPIGTLVGYAAQAPATWAGGTTRAIYAYPPEAIGAPANAQIWVGTAAIDRAAAYSYFPERARVHVPIHGNGIHLHFQSPTEVVGLSTFEQCRFDGARPVLVALVDGAIVAFNLIVQPDVAAEIQVLHIGGEQQALELDTAPPTQAQSAPATSVIHVVYAVNGAVAIEIAGQPAITLQPDDAFVLQPRAVTQPLGVSVVLRSLKAQADVAVATLVFDTASAE